ncbi:MAG: helix-hairpin-helix domain-containing protein [Eubacterium sp.]|nr:helix-hairpin-helix domain-containing protein [Eubacterium sp.]
MKSNKSHTWYMLGTALLLIGGAFILTALSQPELYVEEKELPVSSAYSISVKENESAPEDDNVPAPAVTPEYPLNINTATLEELMTIEGIGEKKASAIIEYRNYLGGYTSVEQLMEIEGFGEETYKSIAGYLTV